MGLFNRKNRESVELRQLMKRASSYLMWDRELEFGFIFYLGLSITSNLQTTKYDLGFDPNTRSSEDKIKRIANLFTDLNIQADLRDDVWLNTIIDFTSTIIDCVLTVGDNTRELDVQNPFKPTSRNPPCLSWFEGINLNPAKLHYLYSKLFRHIGSELLKMTSDLEEAYIQGSLSWTMLVYTKGRLAPVLIETLHSSLPPSFHYASQIPIFYSINKNMPLKIPACVRILESFMIQHDIDSEIFDKVRHLYCHYAISESFKGGFEDNSSLLGQVKPGFKLHEFTDLVAFLGASVPNIRKSNFGDHRNLYLTNWKSTAFDELIDQRLSLDDFFFVLNQAVKRNYGYSINQSWSNRGQALEFLATMHFEIAISMLLPREIY